MLLPHHGFTILLTENPKVLIEFSVSTLVFTKVLTVFAVKKSVWRVSLLQLYRTHVTENFPRLRTLG